MTCKTCILYDCFVELLDVLDCEYLITKLPVCNCDHHEPQAIAQHEIANVAYFWDCPIHGKRTEKGLQEMIEGEGFYGDQLLY